MSLQELTNKTISLAFICKDETDELQRMLASAKQFGFDSLKAGWNGSSEATRKILEENGCEIHQFKWKDDFAYARNLIQDRCTSEFILWLDCDEIIENPGILKQKFLASDCDCIFTMLDYHDSVKFWNRKIYRRSAYRWKGRIHEELVSEIPVREMQVDGTGIKHFYVARETRGERNLLISRQAYEEDPNPKNCYNYAATLFDSCQPEAALPIMEKAIGGLDGSDFLMSALRYASSAYITLNDLPKLRDTATRMILASKNRPEGYFKMAAYYYLRGNMEKCLKYVKRGFSRDHPNDGVPIPYEEYTLIPGRIFASASIALRDFTGAMSIVNHISKDYPDDPWTKDTKLFLLKKTLK